MRIFKVIKEYNRFYLCENIDNNLRECFLKKEYTPKSNMIFVPDEYEANRRAMLEWWENKREADKNDELSRVEKEI